MGADFGKPIVDFTDAGGIMRGVRFLEQRGALQISGQHRIDQALMSARRLLGERPDARPAIEQYRSAVRLQFARNQAQQGGLARAVAAHQRRAASGRDRNRGVFKDCAPGDPVGEVIDL